MPFVDKTTETKKVDITIEGYPDEWVEIKKFVPYGYIRDITKRDTKDAEDAGMEMVLQLAVAWNVRDDDGEVAELNKENIARLANSQVAAIVNECTEVIRGPLPKSKPAA